MFRADFFMYTSKPMQILPYLLRIIRMVEQIKPELDLTYQPALW